MTSTRTATSPDTQRRLAWAVLAAAVLQVVAPVVTALGPGATAGEGSGPELLITPVGWAFSIWGVIYTLAIAQAIAAVASSSARVPRRFQIDQLVLYVGATVWIVMAGLDSSTLTFLALAVMFAAALDGVLTLTRATIEPSRLQTLTRVAFGLFAGWVSAAFFLNLSTALVDWGVVEADALGWQLGVLVVAGLSILAVELRTALPTYAAAGIWAFVGIAVTGATNDDGVVLAAALVAAVCVLVAAVAARRVGSLSARSSAARR